MLMCIQLALDDREKTRGSDELVQRLNDLKAGEMTTSMRTDVRFALPRVLYLLTAGSGQLP